jgi:hypothetical protein
MGARHVAGGGLNNAVPSCAPTPCGSVQCHAAARQAPGTAKRSAWYAQGAAGEPLHRQRRPLQRVRDDDVVQERRILLPDLVLLRNHALLDVVCGAGAWERKVIGAGTPARVSTQLRPQTAAGRRANRGENPHGPQGSGRPHGRRRLSATTEGGAVSQAHNRADAAVNAVRCQLVLGACERACAGPALDF